MTTLQKLQEMAEVRVYAADFALDDRHKTVINVRLVSFDEYEESCDELGRDPAGFLAGQFLDPNTGERLFSADQIRHLTKQMVMKLAQLWIDVQLGREGKEE